MPSRQQRPSGSASSSSSQDLRKATCRSNQASSQDVPQPTEPAAYSPNNQIWRIGTKMRTASRSAGGKAKRAGGAPAKNPPHNARGGGEDGGPPPQPGP